MLAVPEKEASMPTHRSPRLSRLAAAGAFAVVAAGTAACNAGGGDGTASGAGWYHNPGGSVDVPHTTGPAEELPDLTVDHDMLAGSLSFGQEFRDDNDCAVQEGCIIGGMTRQVLRFDVGVMNVGAVDLQVGDPADHPDDFEYSSCHGHYHFKGFARYALSNSNGVVATGAKRAFCLMDINHWSDNSGPNYSVYSCGDQGISVGWEDVYDKSLDCQWVDITDVPPGDYTLSVTVNAENRIAEKGSAPNTVSVPVTIP